jgi:hypothetical protein
MRGRSTIARRPRGAITIVIDLITKGLRRADDACATASRDGARRNRVGCSSVLFFTVPEARKR